jgi:plasmid replication initiation protein
VINEQHLVVQSNPLVKAQYKLSEAEQKLLRVIISMIQPDTTGLEKKFYRFSVQDFAKFLGRTKDHDIHQQMRRMAQNLKNSNVTVTLPNGDTIKASWVAAYKYPKNKGWIEFEISWMLEEQLLRVKEQFTKYYLSNISKLKGEYSVRIYELVQQYANSNMRSRKIDLEDLRDMLALPDAYKKAFNLFQWVIRPSHKEVCAKTDISFSFKRPLYLLQSSP